MAFSIPDAVSTGAAEIRALIADLATIAFSQSMLALRQFFSPSEFVNTIAGIPDLMIDRVSDTPRRIVTRILQQLEKFPLAKSLRSRVMTADKARSFVITMIGIQVAELADPPSRRVLRGVANVIGHGGLPSFRERLEKKLGDLSLSATESRLQRLLGTLLSPARFIVWLLRIWDLSVQIFITVIGFVLLTAVYAFLRSPAGEADVKRLALPQTNPRKTIGVNEEAFVALDAFTFLLRGPPYPRPPWGADDVSIFTLSRKRIRYKK